VNKDYQYQVIIMLTQRNDCVQNKLTDRTHNIL